MESMRLFLRRSLGRSLASMPPLERLRAAWPVACGVVLAQHGQLLALEGGLLTVRVDPPQWLEQFHHMSPVLTRELAAIADVPLREIHFISGRTTARS